MDRRITLTSILYYLAYIIAGGVSIPFLNDIGAKGASIAFGLIFIGIIGLLSFLSLELVDEFSGWFVALGIIRRVFSIIFLLATQLLFVSTYEDIAHGVDHIDLPGMLMLGMAMLPTVYILIRGAVYCFTFDRADERVSLGIGIALPFVCYGISVGMAYLSPIFSLPVLFVVWLLFQVFVRGELGGFGRFLFNFVFHGAFFGLAIYFAVENKPLMFAAFMAMAFCFFYFLGTDLCRESEFWYWAFNAVAGVAVLALFITGMVNASNSGLEGMEYGIKCSFPYVWKNALFFAPFTYAVLRAPLYKLAAENEWENGLGDVFMTLLLPAVAYLLTIPLLLIGYIYVITSIIGIIIIAMLIMYIRDQYPPFPDYVTDIRDSADNYITSITILE